MRFPEQYRHWKQTNQGHHISGTPLKMWPPATPVQIKELEAIHVYSVEDLASIADVHLSRIPDGRMWRDKAAAWLKVAADSVAAVKLQAMNDDLQAQINELKKGHRHQKLEHKKAFSVAKSEKMKAAWAKRKAVSIEGAEQ